MIVDDKKFLIAGALLQVLLLGVLVTVLHPHLTRESVICVLLLLAAEFVIYREVRGMKEPVAQPRTVGDLKRKRP